MSENIPLPALQNLQEVAKGFASVIENLNRSLVSIAEIIANTDWDEIFRDQDKSILHMAECGWTLPFWLDIRHLRTIHLIPRDELDLLFVNGFMENDSENLKVLGQNLIALPDFSQWHPLIEDIITSILAKSHRVTIPATLTIMEGYISKTLVSADITDPKDTHIFKHLNHAQWDEGNNLEAVLGESGMAFFRQVFSFSDFTQGPPTYINRHWILHGRAPVNWTLRDALRLVNALQTLPYSLANIGQVTP